MLKNDKFNFVIALLIAVGLWVYVVGIENPVKKISIKDVPISFTNVETLADDGLTLLSVSDRTVDVQISGNRSEIKNVKRDDIKITADLEGYKEGEHTVRLQIGRISNVDIESKQKITVVVDQLVTEEKPILISLDGAVSDEKEPYVVQVSDETAMVTGAETLVESVVKINAPLDIERVDSELKAFTVNLEPVNQAGETVNGVTLDVTSVSVSAVNLSKKTVRLDVPVEGQNSDDVERTVNIPKTITVKGLDAELRNLESITAETMDVSQVFENTAMKIVPILPNGVEVASNSQNLQIQVTVHGMGKRVFEYKNDAVIVEGVKENMTVTVEDMDIQLTVTGRESVTETLSDEDFSFVVNVRNLEPGTHEVIMNCRYDKQLRLVVFTPETIKVVIENKEELPQQDTETEGKNPEGAETEPGTDTKADEDASAVSGNEETSDADLQPGAES